MPVGLIRMRSLSPNLPVLAGFLLAAVCGDREEPVGCLVGTAHGLTVVAPDAPFATRHKAVSDEVRWQNETTLLPAAMCADSKPEQRASKCHQQPSTDLAAAAERVNDYVAKRSEERPRVVALAAVR